MASASKSRDHDVEAQRDVLQTHRASMTFLAVLF